MTAPQVNPNSPHFADDATAKLHTALTDAQRLNALRQTALLDSPAEAAFDRLTRLATTILHAPIALVSLVDAERQFFKSCVGLPEPWSSECQTPLTHSFCQHIVATNTPLIISDAREHPLVAQNLAIPDLHVIAYAGMPLHTPDGHVIGSFCVIDTEPRAWQDDEIAILRDLAAAVMTEIELRATLREIEQQRSLVEQHAQELENAHSRIRTIFESITDAFFALDHEWRFTYANAQSEPLLHHKRADLLGKRFWDVYPRMVGTIFQEQYERAVAEGVTVSFEAYYPPLDGWYEVRAYPLPGGLSVYFRDITARKQMEAERERLAQMREEFLHIASHELRAPLTPIILGLSLLQRSIQTDNRQGKNQQRITEIIGRTKHLARLVDDMLSMTRISQGKFQLELQMCDVLGVTRDAIAAQAALWNRQITCASGATEVLTYADPDRLWQVLSNLINNALKYSPPLSPVTVVVALSQDQGPLSAQIQVRDQGAGIAPEHLPHLFDRFYRGAATEQQDGLGLGLYIAQAIMQAHGGDITVTSQPGAGSVFTVTLPLASVPEHE